MKYKEYTKHLPAFALIALVLCTGIFLSSCNEDEDKGSKQTELFSFGPAGVKHGEAIKFIGRNLDQVSSIVLAPGIEISADQFVTQTSDLIEILIPQAAEAGKVILKTSSGEIETKTALSFEVPVVITSVTNEARPGANISIQGELVNWIEEVEFTDGIVVTEFVSKSVDEVVVTVPMEAKTGFLIFRSGGTEPLEFDSEGELVVTLPTVSSLSPPSIRHALNLSITGTDLDLVTALKFTGSATIPMNNFVSQSATQIVVTVPATTTVGKLTLTVPSGEQVVTDQTLTIILPIVTALSPSNTADHNPGTTLTMTGTDLDLVDKIAFPGAATPVTNFTTSPAGDQIQVVIPDGAKGGSLVVTTKHGFSVPVTIPFGNQLQLAKVIFDEAIRSPFAGGGGWNATSEDFANTENPRVGTISVKATFGGDWGGASQFGSWGNPPLSTAGTAYFAFSIYGGPGTEGKVINVNIKDTSDAIVQVTIEEGEWKDVQIALSDINNPPQITEVWFQDRGWSGTVFIDHVGLK